MRNVLVTGSTGFLGSNLAHALMREGCHVRILRRQTSDLRMIDGIDAEHCIGDVRDIDSIRRAIKGCDTVFHTAALVSYWRRERDLMYDINIDGTKNVVCACLEAGVEQLVHTSSVAAIGYRPGTQLADESTPFNWDAFDIGYRISKHRAERDVLTGVAHGLQAVIVNPTIIIGPRDIHFHGGQLIRDVHRKRIFYAPRGGLNVVFVDDVVRAHLAAAQQGRIGERYITCGENLTYRDALRIIAEEVGGIAPFFTLPTAVVRSVGAFAEAAGNLTNSKPWVTRELTASIDQFNWFSCEKAKRELNYAITPFREAARTTFNWYREHGLL